MMRKPLIDRVARQPAGLAKAKPATLRSRALLAFHTNRYTLT
jgi:hypothetical protein